MGFAEKLRCAGEETDRRLTEALDRLSGEGRAPRRLLEATAHAVLAGGKRFRPFLVIECAELFDGDRAAAVSVGAAFECLHAYSLVHDDLPSMDDDDMRRGRPTVHRAYDEATAILVGDGLQALAFQLLAEPPVPAEHRGALVQTLASASGFAGMVGGQYRDLNADGLDAAGIRLMQGMKTGALIRASCAAGAILSGAPEAERKRVMRFGELVGEAFQLADDLLDRDGSAEEVGKRVGKDVDEGKATLAELIGADAARQALAETVAAAEDILEPFGGRGATLRAAARFVAERRS